MAKHPVPKYKTSRSRSKKRHATWESQLANYWENKTQAVKCSDCEKPKLAHHICQECGSYKGRKIINKDKASDAKIKVVKA